MITLTFEKTLRPNFGKALTKLSRYGGFDPQSALKVGKLVQKIRDFSQVGVNSHNALLVSYGEKKPDGSIVEKDGQVSVPDGKAAEFEEKLKELKASKITMTLPPLDGMLLEGTGITPEEILEIEDLVDLAEKPKLKSV